MPGEGGAGDPRIQGDCGDGRKTGSPGHAEKAQRPGEETQIFFFEIKYLTKTPALQYIFQQVREDEKKHHMILETLMTKRFEKDSDRQGGFLLNF
jgi:hypothetical protein